MDPSPLLTIAISTLTPFANNRNTGVCYEFYVAFQLLRKMGLSDDDVVSLRPLVDAISTKNSRCSEKFKQVYDNITKVPVGNGITIHGVKVVSLRNVTQDDGDGGTGDLVLILENEQQKSISICQGTTKRNGSIEKCLKNPSCRGFGCDDTDIEEFKKIAAEAVIEYKADMTRDHGSNEELWPSRTRSKAAIDAPTKVAKLVDQRFNTLTEEQRIMLFKDLIHITEGIPADFICIVNKECSSHKLFEITGLVDGLLWKPELKAEGIYLKMYLGDYEIGKTQVKFNNGVYHKGKTSSLTSSWNATVGINKIFKVPKSDIF